MSYLAKGSKAVAPLAALVIALALSIVVGAPAQALAAQADTGLAAGGVEVQTQAKKPKLITPTLWLGANMYNSAIIQNMPTKAKITKATSKNAKVLKVTRDKSQNYVLLTPKKAGKAKVSITYKVGSKATTVTGTYTVKAFPKPLKSVTLNGKKLQIPTSKNKTNMFTTYNFTGTAATVKVVPAKGWKLSNMSGGIWWNNGINHKSVAVKNGKKFKVPKGKNGEVYLTLTNSKGDAFSCTYTINRGGLVEFDKGAYFVGYSGNAHFRYNGNIGDSAKVVSFTSSDPSVLKAEKYGDSIMSAYFEALKPGKSTVKLTYTYGGKKYSTSAVCVVKKYANPFASLAVNGEKVNVTVDNGFLHDVGNYNASTAKVSATAAKGWKVAYSTYSTSEDPGGDYKNGASVSVPKGGNTTVMYAMQNTAGDMIYYSVVIWRD